MEEQKKPWIPCACGVGPPGWTRTLTNIPDIFNRESK